MDENPTKSGSHRFSDLWKKLAVVRFFKSLNFTLIKKKLRSRISIKFSFQSSNWQAFPNQIGYILDSITAIRNLPAPNGPNCPITGTFLLHSSWIL